MLPAAEAASVVEYATYKKMHSSVWFWKFHNLSDQMCSQLEKQYLLQA
jgi:hypothetical protein